jgi:hypothetical protein
VQGQGNGQESVQGFFYDFLPDKARALKANSVFAKRYLCEKVSGLLEKFRENKEMKGDIVKEHGVVDFLEDPIFKLSYNEYKFEGTAMGRVQYTKTKPAQMFLENRRYDLYLLDLSVINRYFLL